MTRDEHQPLHGGAPSKGFTLLEVLLGIGVLIMLVTGALAIISGPVQLTRSVVTANERWMQEDAFLRLLRSNFESLPPGARVTLYPPDSMSRGMLVIRNAPGAFPLEGQPVYPESIFLLTRENRAGLWDLWLGYYAGNFVTALEDNAIEEDHLFEFPLVRDMRQFDMYAWDADENEWFDDWEEVGRNPQRLLLDFWLPGQQAAQRTTFWLASPPSSQ